MMVEKKTAKVCGVFSPLRGVAIPTFASGESGQSIRRGFESVNTAVKVARISGRVSAIIMVAYRGWLAV